MRRKLQLLRLSALLSAILIAALPSGCGPEFENCDARRDCPSEPKGGAGRVNGGAGAPEAGESGMGGGVGGSGERGGATGEPTSGAGGETSFGGTGGEPIGGAGNLGGAGGAIDAGAGGDQAGMSSGASAQGGSGKGGATQEGGATSGGASQGGVGGTAQGGAGKGGSAQGGTASKGGNGGAPTAGTSAAGGAGTAGGSGGWIGTGGGTGTGGIPATGKPFVAQGPSCTGLSSNCQGESCCTSIAMPGGTFQMGRSQLTGASDYYEVSATEADEVPEHVATVAPFALDKYEVTVGRFRKFVAAYDQWLQSHPVQKEGANPSTQKTGWGESWTPSGSDLPVSAASLVGNVKCSAPMFQTWADTEGANDLLAINCVSWFEAFAFCIWDGGRLPTEAEWEYAAAGGIQNRLYPWGSDSPTEDRVFRVSEDTRFYPVGGKPLGAGYFGHLDLAGSAWEWTFDWYSTTFYGSEQTPSACVNCANTSSADFRSRRGGSWNEFTSEFRASNRLYFSPVNRVFDVGFRCARPGL